MRKWHEETSGEFPDDFLEENKKFVNRDCLPCPFCGCNIILNYNNRVECSNCYISIEGDDENKATDLWNRRSKTERVDSEDNYYDPCPFCAGTEIIEGTDPYFEAFHNYVLKCKKCGAQTFPGPDAVEDWNRRASR